MRTKTILSLTSALAIMGVTLGGSVAAAQDAMPPPPPTETSDPASDMPPVDTTAEMMEEAPVSTMTPEMQTETMAGWPPERQADFQTWPEDHQAYFWSLPAERQEIFWRLTPVDRLRLLAMSPDEKVMAWEAINAQVQGMADSGVAPADTTSDGTYEQRSDDAMPPPPPAANDASDPMVDEVDTTIDQSVEEPR